MSARALKKLREDREIAEKRGLEDVDEEEEEEVSKPSGGGAFLSMIEDSSSDEESEEEDNNNADGVEEDVQNREVENKSDADSNVDGVARAPVLVDEEEEEDFDAILAEFDNATDLSGLKTDKATESCFATVTAGLDIRDLDLEYVQRNNLLGGGGSDDAAPRRSRQALLFGPAREGWGRPPHYVGGGMGMTSYDQHPSPLRWPYSSSDVEGEKDPKLWFTFLQSDTYQAMLEQYRQIQESGDVNALCLFVADNPFCAEALLQLAKVVYQTNNNGDGLSLLRRALYVYECAAVKSFAPNFVDFDLEENSTFFHALTLLTQVSSIAGCMRTALAVSRYVLAMDPLRDPKGALLSLDFFALSTRAHDLFVVDLVENGGIKIKYKDTDSNEFECELTGLPNWAYSYALALYRLEEGSGKPGSNEVETTTSSQALVSAIRKFPTVVEELLRKNEISTSGKSTRTDWPTVLEKLRQLALPLSRDPRYDPILYHASKSASTLVIHVFVERSFKLWSGSDVQKWLYDACTKAISSEEKRTLEHPSPALQRYARIDPADYKDRFQLLPEEGNPLDPGLLHYALHVDTNRRRLLRRGNRGDHGGIDPLEALENRARAGQQGILLGGPPTHNIDPDSPLMEILWQSMLPWNQVEGVVPPRR